MWLLNTYWNSQSIESNYNSVFLGNVYVFKINERAQVGDIVGRVQAVDADQAENALISYTLKNATDDLPVTIDSDTGDITLVSVPRNKRK